MYTIVFVFFCLSVWGVWLFIFGCVCFFGCFFFAVWLLVVVGLGFFWVFFFLGGGFGCSCCFLGFFFNNLNHFPMTDVVVHFIVCCCLFLCLV